MGFFSKRSDTLIGVDIGATAIKLVELSRSRSGYELASFAAVPLPRGAVSENSVVDSAAVSAALVEAVRTAKPSTRNVAVALFSNSVIIKTITIPAMSELELEGQIEIEAYDHIPYDINEVFIDFYIQGMNYEEPELMDVVLVACKRDLVESYKALLSGAGLVPKCIDCSLFAVENGSEVAGLCAPKKNNQLPRLPDEGADVYALVNISATIMSVNVLINGRMAFIREQFYGGKKLTEEIEKYHGIDYQAAEELKLRDFATVHPDALKKFYLGLSSELVRSIDLYSAGKPDFLVQKVFITGGCALIPGIVDELEQSLGIECEILNPFDHIKIPKKKFDMDYLRKIGPMLMVPIGLAMRSFDE